MKQVKIYIPAEKTKLVQDLEENLDISFEISIYQDKATLVTNVDNSSTPSILGELKGLGIGTVFGSITISPVDIEINSKQKKGKKLGRSISIDEMIFNIKGLGLVTRTFVGLSVLAGVLAAFGLINDNVVIIIASMIIAPFLGPIALSVIGSFLPKERYRIKAIIAEATGLGICVLIGFLVGLSFRLTPDQIQSRIPTQIFIRTQPGIGDIVFAILSGLAGGIFIVRGESANIVGVAVAASLCPPAANIGVLLSNLLLPEAFRCTMLLLLNVISIFSACAIIFWSSQTLIKGGTISKRDYEKMSKKYLFQTIIAISILILIITIIIATGFVQ